VVLGDELHHGRLLDEQAAPLKEFKRGQRTLYNCTGLTGRCWRQGTGRIEAE
jgi:hypothetical protein